MGYKITIPGANYGEMEDPYLIAAGITDTTIRDSYMVFKNTLVNNGIWDKITHAYAILGTTADQVKLNIKNASDPLTNSGGGDIVNTINKGIVLAGIGNSQGATVDVPLNETFIESFRNGSGHAMYFINESLTATNTIVAGLAIPISSSSFLNATNPLFYLTGAFGKSPQKKALFLRNTSSQLAGDFINKGAFGVVKNGNTSEFIGNGVSLGTSTHSGTSNTFTGNIRLGDGKYPVANTISFVSFGNMPMSPQEMVIYQNAIKTLINSVHGIAV